MLLVMCGSGTGSTLSIFPLEDMMKVDWTYDLIKTEAFEANCKYYESDENFKLLKTLVYVTSIMLTDPPIRLFCDVILLI